MIIKRSEYLTKKIIHQHTYPHNFGVSDDLAESEKGFCESHYQMQINETWFDGVHISLIKVSTQEAEDFYYESTHPCIDLLFCMEGSINFYNASKAGYLLALAKNQQHISFGRLNPVVINLIGQASYIHIQLTESYFKQVTNQEFKNQIPFNLKFITPETSILLKHFNNQQYHGRVKRIFLESKIFELIISYLQTENAQPVLLKEDDVRKILLAKQLVESNLQQPNSLMELSRKAGINDYKLKKGFKMLTGHTVFGYLYKLRMETAYYFLIHEKKTVNEVAFLVGYKNAQHFISAFKKQYDVSPGTLTKLRMVTDGV